LGRIIRIGTRDSELALWQARTVQRRLENFGYKTTLVPVKSTGDIVLDKPLYELGITGIFTKTLDIAMLNNDVDIAVHSMKDVPTALPKGIIQTAVLERADTHDILVTKQDVDFSKSCVIATGSLRRKAQWLYKYPNHTVVDLRGNVNTRLQKLQDNNWDAAIFAKAGLERIEVLPKNYQVLDWMLPAPAQGAMMVVALKDDEYAIEATQQLNDHKSNICTQIERSFLRTLEGGCTAPIGALATVDDDTLYFEGCLFSLDGKDKITVQDNFRLTVLDDANVEKCKVSVAHKAGERIAQLLLKKGGVELMKDIKKNLR